jgi:formate hydrogenlyase subunit 3/multisubunit Na+/H+ antiporter MnhD subunit
LPELARIALHPHAQATPTLVIFLGLASAGFFLGVPPFHSWLERAMRPTLAPLTGFAGLLGALILARSSFTLFPHSQVELSQILLWAGALSLVCTLIFLLSAKELSTFSAAVGLLGTSVALAAFGSGTMQGLEAGIVLLAVRCLALPLLLLLGATLVERTGESRLAQHAGLHAVAPGFSASYAFALLSAAGLPGGAASFAALLALLGAVGRWPTLAVVGVALWCVAAVFAARGFSILRGDAPKWWSKALRLEAQGGKPQDLRAEERIWGLLLIVALLAMLFLPRLWFGSTARTLLDVFRALGAPSPTQVS